MLNPYHKFSFTMPRKGRDFTPQQKSAITRKWKQLRTVIESHQEKDTTFIKYKKGRPIAKDTKRALTHSNKGVFIPVKNAKVTPKGNISSVFYEKREIFLPLPKAIYENPSLIPQWLEQLHEKYFPATIMLSMRDRRGRSMYSPMDAEKYFYEAFMHFGGESGTRNRINGVFITTYDESEFKSIYNISEGHYQIAKAGEVVRGEELSFDPMKEGAKFVIKVYDKDRKWFTASHYAKDKDEAFDMFLEMYQRYSKEFYLITMFEIKGGKFSKVK